MLLALDVAGILRNILTQTQKSNRLPYYISSVLLLCLALWVSWAVGPLFALIVLLVIAGNVFLSYRLNTHRLAVLRRLNVVVIILGIGTVAAVGIFFAWIVSFSF